MDGKKKPNWEELNNRYWDLYKIKILQRNLLSITDDEEMEEPKSLIDNKIINSNPVDNSTAPSKNGK